MPILTCQNEPCGKEFKSRKSKKRFCSNACYLEHRKNNPEEFSKGNFKKGVKSWNAGKKLTKIGDFMIRKKILKSGNTKRLRFVNVGDGEGGIKYVRNDRHVWEQENGPLPSGYVIYHKDGRTLNDDIDNLEAILFGEALSRYAALREKVYDLKNKKDIAKIVKGCKVNDRRIQRLLFEMTYDNSMGACMRYAKDRDTAQDILSDAYVKVFDKIDTFKGKNLAGWISRIVVNTAIDSFRRNKNTFATEVETMEYDEALQTVDADYELEGLEEIKGLPTAQVLKEVQNLSPQYRLVFNMYVFEDMTHRQIGEQLGISEGTSKSNLSKARETLRNRVALLVKKANQDKERMIEGYRSHELA